MAMLFIAVPSFMCVNCLLDDINVIQVNEKFFKLERDGTKRRQTRSGWVVRIIE